MICLNRADEGSLRHLTYNQSPPALAANQTTRQDLNGISNLREYVAASQDDASGGGTGGMLGETPLTDKLRREGSHIFWRGCRTQDDGLVVCIEPSLGAPLPVLIRLA